MLVVPELPEFPCGGESVFYFAKQFQSIEILEVNDSIRTQCFESLKKAVESIPQVSHGILFAGTKVLSTYSKQRSFELSSMDLFLLIIYVSGAFNPHGKVMDSCTYRS